MKQLYVFSVFLTATVFISGCKLHVIVPEGGEVRAASEELYTCTPGSECVFELEEPSTLAWGESFLAVPDSGWFFHKWKAGNRFHCPRLALPECYIDYEWFEDNRRLVSEIFDPSQHAYLMPVFKRYPRASLGDEPRTITAEGVKQLWLEPTDFAEYTPDQVAAVCPEGICSETLPGSSIDLSGHF